MSFLQHLPADTRPLSRLARKLASGQLNHARVSVPQRAQDVPLSAARRFDSRHRRVLSEQLEAQLAPFEPHVHALDSVRAIQRLDSEVVLYRATPRFLMGTLADVVAGARLVSLADEMSRLRRTPVLPLVLLETERFTRERATSAFLDGDYDLCHIHPGELHGRRGLPQSKSTQRAVRARIDHAHGDRPERVNALDTLIPREDEDLDGASMRAWLELFGEQGLIVVDDHAIAQDMARQFAAMLDCRTTDLLEQGRREVDHDATNDADEAEIAVHLGPGFDEARALFVDGGDIVYAGEPGSRTPIELATEVLQDPGLIVPGTRISTLVAEKLFPVTAIVGDTQELGFALEADALRRALELVPPVLVPCPGATFLEREDERALERLGLDLREILSSGSVPRDQNSEDERADVQEPLAIEELRAFIKNLRGRARELGRALTGVDPSLRSLAKRAGGRSARPFEELLEKSIHLHNNRRAKSERHHRRLTNALVPGGRAQEPSLSPLALLARHGTGLVAALCSEVGPFGCEHLVVRPGQAGARPAGRTGPPWEAGLGLE